MANYPPQGKALSSLVIDVDKDWNGKSITNMDMVSVTQGNFGHLLFGNDYYLAELEDGGIALCRDDNTVLLILDSEGNVYVKGEKKKVEEW